MPWSSSLSQSDKVRAMKRLPFVLLLLMVFVLALCTIVEKWFGTAIAHSLGYGSVPFVMLWLAIAVTAGIAIFRSQYAHRWHIVLLHVSLLIILLGAGITWATATSGRMELSEGDTTESFVDENGNGHTIPFAVKLLNFDIEYYPGTNTPMDYVSHLLLEDKEVTVSMNNIGKYKGYRFYQMGYDSGGGGTVLSVTHDPWGIMVTYVGYMMLGLSMMLVLVDKRSRFRALLRHPALRSATWIVLLLVSLWTGKASASAPRVLPDTVSQHFARLYIMHNGRVAPFETFARDFAMSLYGKDNVMGYSATQVTTGWMFYYDDWKNCPMKRGRAQSSRGTDVDDPRNELAMMVATGSLVKLFPVKWHGQLQWYSQIDGALPADIDEGQWVFVRKGLDYLNELVVKNDWPGAISFIDKLRKYQVEEAGADLPSDVQFQSELLYNRLDNYRPWAIALLVAGVLMFVFTAQCLAGRRPLPRWLCWMVYILGVAAWIHVTVALALRWIVGGHLPMSNGFEVMLFMGWMGLLSLGVLACRKSVLMPFGLLLAGFALLVATMGNNNPRIGLLTPVLQSPLLCLHVAVIMMAYSLLVFLLLNGVMALFLRKHGKAVEQLHILGQVLLYPSVFLLAAGIFVGAVWAGISWGSYWSWDPKETWALITLLVYSLPLHVLSLRIFSRPMVFHVYCVVAFLCVLITYFGVNYLLGGMHSYA